MATNPLGPPPGTGLSVRRVTLSNKAARYVRARATIAGPRYTKADANATASAILEAAADGRLLRITNDMIAARAYLQNARALCFSEQAQRGIDQLIAALEIIPA